MTTPVFLLSLPRSGSTLLQRILSAHKKIAATAEPWILLPLLNMSGNENTLSTYSQLESSRAINDFISFLPEKEADFKRQLRSFVSNLYSLQCKNDETYFLDKTPRYYFIIDEIYRLFPEARFIFLFRNPLHVLASIINTYGDGRLHKLCNNLIDFEIGIPSLSEGYQSIKHSAITVHYEKLVEQPESELDRIYSYLGLEKDTSILQNLDKARIGGRMGDPTGVKAYRRISKGPMGKWTQTFDTHYRKAFLKRLLAGVSSDHISTHGYNKQDLLRQIDELPGSWNGLLRDVVDVTYTRSVLLTHANLFFGKYASHWKGKYLN